MPDLSPSAREAWLRGPAPGVAALLQPVAHALVQARDEVRLALDAFPDAALDVRPAGMASVAFHLRHLAGVLDRLLTYARGEALDAAQLDALAREEDPAQASCTDLLAGFERQVDAALAQLRATDPEALTEARGVGRERVPSTVIGLLVHAAEHTTRHTGQLLVTARVAAAAHEHRPRPTP